MSQTLKAAPVAADAEPSVSDDLLARIVTETERQVTAKANRPAPIRLRTLDELERFAEMAASSTAVPKDYQGKPANCMVAIQMGSELGLAPMQSLQNIAVVNGRPAVWGDAMPGLCRASGMMAYMREWSDGEGELLTWHCETKRRDDPNPVRRDFSIADAKTAKLWGKKGYNGQDTPWITNPGRMLQMRARGFSLRDAFPDVLRGLISAEEAADIPYEDRASLPPVATAAPIRTARDALNDTIPLRSAAAATPRAPRRADPEVYDAEPAEKPQRTDEQWEVWIAKLRAACAVLKHRQEVVEIGGKDSVRDAIRDAPDRFKRDISAILAEAFERFPAEPGDDLDEVVIEGEHNLAAG